MTQAHWSTILAEMMVDPDDLATHLALPKQVWQDILASHKDFPLRMPRRWLDKIPKGNLDHPLLKQVLPSKNEQLITPGYSKDPLAEKSANPIPGLLHKYHGRVLIIAAPSCAIHCRYCFRRHFPYDENHNGKQQWQQIIHYIQADPSIHEVILSGGDPLMLKNNVIDELSVKLDNIPHIDTLRIHTRMPVILPERIDQEFIEICQKLRSQTTIVMHSNHALELDDDVAEKLKQLHQAGIVLLNQAVLLRGVNDNLSALIDLSKRLWQCRTLPYYLHMPDKIQGTAHFDVTNVAAQQLIQQLSQKLPGYLVPKLVQEIPGEGAKTIIA